MADLALDFDLANGTPADAEKLALNLLDLQDRLNNFPDDGLQSPNHGAWRALPAGPAFAVSGTGAFSETANTTAVHYLLPGDHAVAGMTLRLRFRAALRAGGDMGAFTIRMREVTDFASSGGPPVLGAELAAVALDPAGAGLLQGSVQWTVVGGAPPFHWCPTIQCAELGGFSATIVAMLEARNI